ncbi:hypothetical protein [Parabacteroides sp.]
MSELNGWETSLCVVVAIRSPQMLKRIVVGVSNPNIDFPNIIAPNTVFLDKERFTMG